MAIVPVHCPVSHFGVVRITDLEGKTTRMLCPEYDEASGACQIKMRAANLGGPRDRLIERSYEGTLAAHSVRCGLV